MNLCSYPKSAQPLHGHCENGLLIIDLWFPYVDLLIPDVIYVYSYWTYDEWSIWINVWMFENA